MERVAGYRRLAEEARELARMATDIKAEESFNLIADTWDMLAREVEAFADWKRTANAPGRPRTDH